MEEEQDFHQRLQTQNVLNEEFLSQRSGSKAEQAHIISYS